MTTVYTRANGRIARWGDMPQWVLHIPMDAPDLNGAIAAAMMLVRSVQGDVFHLIDTQVSTVNDVSWATRVFCAGCAVPHPNGHGGPCITGAPASPQGY